LDANRFAGDPLPAVDPAALDRLRRFGGRTLLARMIDLFLIAVPERLDAAARAGATGDAEGVERALHSLKSSSAQLGAMRMQRLSEQGEHRARTGSLDGVAQLTSALDDEFARVREWLTSARDEQGAA
jgi:HPt (histidine-containing phosphotransfer) domain-containing protein